LRFVIATSVRQDTSLGQALQTDIAAVNSVNDAREFAIFLT
jgi:hypothetical protein